MDNIKDVTIFRRIAKWANSVLFLFPILVDLLSIASLLFPSLDKTVSSNISTPVRWIILFSVNLILISSVFIYLERRNKERIDIALSFVEGYRDLLKKYTLHLLKFEEICDKFESIDELYSTVYGYLKSIVDLVSATLSKVTGEKIRVCIKSFPQKYTHRDVYQMELITFCRSNASAAESEIERLDRVKVNENTDFKEIMVASYPYFAFNGLTDFQKITKREYENSTKDWMKKYNATIVHPISKCVSYNKTKETYEILGFLCADTLSTKAFSTDFGRSCQIYLASVSSLLYVFLEKCILCRERIEQTQHNIESEAS